MREVGEYMIPGFLTDEQFADYPEPPPEPTGRAEQNDWQWDIWRKNLRSFVKNIIL